VSHHSFFCGLAAWLGSWVIGFVCRDDEAMMSEAVLRGLLVVAYVLYVEELDMLGKEGGVEYGRRA